jgi:starch synthase (maltosyl-transferring)
MAPPSTNAWEGQRRVVIEGVAPEIDGGRYPAKRVVGDSLTVEADIFTDGHDVVSATLLYRKKGSERWQETPMQPLPNDRWRAAFPLDELGRYEYTLEGWVDSFATWRRGLAKKIQAGEDSRVDYTIGAKLIEEAAGDECPDRLRQWAQLLRDDSLAVDVLRTEAMSADISDLMASHPDRRFAIRYPRELEVVVDPPLAGFSAWYEFFPRSASGEPGRHGTFKDCEARLPYVASMGFDILYFPPIHPIGRGFRKGKNNSPLAESGDIGSPWAIGASEGGHKSVHPDLGTIEEFRALVEQARSFGLEIALDIAFQCAPDHPYVKEHPEWFRWRPDGTVQYAENPPKKYQDIYPFDFECENWAELWDELKSVFLFWIGHGVRVFRVDNPHTKPLRFWEWVIGEVKREHPETIFLSEAFTRPKVMYNLAKAGFTHSYTYFTWRTTRKEITDYLTELTQTQVREYFRPNFWPNTPDILPEHLQFGGRPAFMGRLVLAATLSSNYGIYGPAFELMEHRAKTFGSEEYLDSEKYELRDWDLNHPDSLRDFIAHVNRIRRANPALHLNSTLSFHPTDNEQLLCYSKRSRDGANIVVVVVNLDPHHTQAGWVNLNLEELGVEETFTYQAHDQLSHARYLWRGSRNYVQLDPQVVPAHIFVIRRKTRTERDFDYFM